MLCLGKKNIDKEEILYLVQLRIWAWIRSKNKNKKHHSHILTGIHVLCITLKLCNNMHIHAITYKSLLDMYTIGHYVANRT